MDDVGSPLAAFARDLRDLRRKAGNPSYRELAHRALFVPSVLSSAASGHKLPTLPVTLAFVAACDGDCAAWERRWRTVAASAGDCQQVASRVPGRPQPADAQAARLSKPAQLPAGVRAFAGRDQMAAAVTGMVRAVPPDQPRPALLLAGPIGIGKTALALRLADELAAEFPDGQLYADLAAFRPGGPASVAVLRGFLQALGVPAAMVPDDPMQRVGLYRSLLAERRLFVLLENAADERQVRPLLGRAARSQVVVTSRAQLLGLDGIVRADLGVLDRSDSIAVLRRTAGAQRVAAEPAAAGAIAETCGDLPLAVSIIGRKIAARPEWTLGHAAALLADHSWLLRSMRVGDVDLGEQLRSAYEQLPAGSRRAARMLADADAGWLTAGDLAGLLDVHVETARDLLESIVDAGLLGRCDAAGRYWLSSLIRAFAASAGEPQYPRLASRPQVSRPGQARCTTAADARAGDRPGLARSSRPGLIVRAR